MTQEVLGNKEADVQNNCADGNLELQQQDTQSEVMRSFQKQQAANLQVKETLALELAEMELPDSVTNQILHIEDELPF